MKQETCIRCMGLLNSISLFSRILQEFVKIACASTFNSLASGCFRGFSEKKRLNARGFAREFLQSSMHLVKVSKDAASLLACTPRKCFRGAVFCEWRHKWRTSQPPWPTLPRPGHQPLGGILKFSLETRLQFESFDTLDDLLGFRVQSLWCKLVKIFD